MILQIRDSDGKIQEVIAIKGDKGDRGATGDPGDPGTTPHIGANGNWWIGTTDTGVKAQGDDYVLTDADKTEIAEEAAELVDIPDKLPNPNALTFSGAVTGTYDGSAPLNVVIPSGGGGTGGASVELDSTLTQPGKAADAKAVGDAIAGQNDAIEKKLDADELPAAVETALAEAKESGEFDGPQGDPGTTPHIGANGNWWIGTTDTGVKAQGEPGQPGDPGDDYVLTDGDIDEIASAAAGKINISGKADKDTVPNSATVNADNELVMQRTDGDAVSELFKVALPAGGEGGSEWELIQDVTLTEDVAEVSLGNGVSYKDMALVVSPMKINNAAGDGASSATTSPKINTGGTYAFIDKMPINSNSIIVITSLLHGGARVNNLYKHSVNNYYYLTNGNASSYYMPTQFTAGATTVSWAKITMSGEWLLKSGCRVTLYGRK